MTWTRRRWLAFSCGLVPAFAADGSISLRGTLRQPKSQPPFLSVGGKPVQLSGDEETLAVLNDARLNGSDFEALGHFSAPGMFAVDPIYNRALFVWRAGKRLLITYWCEVCAIRVSSPGKCRCCQQEMALDPRDPALKDTDPSN
jgi:hypothetical protein